jgi:hypothetical protein
MYLLGRIPVVTATANKVPYIVGSANFKKVFASAASVFSAVFGTFGTIEGNSNPNPAPFPLSSECHVLFDLVVETAHVLSRMTHPVFV